MKKVIVVVGEIGERRTTEIAEAFERFGEASPLTRYQGYFFVRFGLFK